MPATQKHSEAAGSEQASFDIPTPEREHRVRILTPKEAEIYSKEVEKHQTLLRSSLQEVSDFLGRIRESGALVIIGAFKNFGTFRHFGAFSVGGWGVQNLHWGVHAWVVLTLGRCDQHPTAIVDCDPPVIKGDSIPIHIHCRL